jgi:hypothetical protein
VTRIPGSRNRRLFNFGLATVVLCSWGFKAPNVKADLLNIFEYNRDNFDFGQVYARYFEGTSQSKLLIFDAAQSPFYFFDWVAITSNKLPPENVFSRREILSEAEKGTVKEAIDESTVEGLLYKLRKDLLILIPKTKEFSSGITSYCKANPCQIGESGDLRYVFLRNKAENGVGNTL